MKYIMAITVEFYINGEPENMAYHLEKAQRVISNAVIIGKDLSEDVGKFILGDHDSTIDGTSVTGTAPVLRRRAEDGRPRVPAGPDSPG